MSWLNLHLRIPQRYLRRHFYCHYLSHLDRLMIQAAHGCCRELHEKHLVWAIHEDRFKVFCWIYQQRKARVHRWVITRALQDCRFDVLDFLRHEGEITGGKELFEGLFCASFSGNLDVLQWLVTRGIRPDPWSVTIGAIHGRRLDVMEWAVYHDLWLAHRKVAKKLRVDQFP